MQEECTLPSAVRVRKRGGVREEGRPKKEGSGCRDLLSGKLILRARRSKGRGDGRSLSLLQARQSGCGRRGLRVDCKFSLHRAEGLKFTCAPVYSEDMCVNKKKK